MPGIVGRDTELAQLRVAAADRRVISISGVPGVGKSALLTAFLKECESDRGWPVACLDFRAEGELRADPSVHAFAATLDALLGHEGRPRSSAPHRVSHTILGHPIFRRPQGSDWRATRAALEAYASAYLPARQEEKLITPQVVVDAPLPGGSARFTLPLPGRTRNESKLVYQRLMLNPLEYLARCLAQDLNASLESHTQAHPGCRYVIAFDQYECVPREIDKTLRYLEDGRWTQLSDGVLFVFAGSMALSDAWIAGAAAKSILCIVLKPLSQDSVVSILGGLLPAWTQDQLARAASRLGDLGGIPLLLRLIASDPDLSPASFGAGPQGFDWRDVLERYVERQLADTHIAEPTPMAARVISVPRRLTSPVLRLAFAQAGLHSPITDNLPRPDLVDPTVQEVLRRRLAGDDPTMLHELHVALAKYYEAMASGSPPNQIEAAYHGASASGDPSDVIEIALRHLLGSLPQAYGLLQHWSLMLEQLDRERPASMHDGIQRLRALTGRAWDVINRPRSWEVDPVVDVFNADAFFWAKPRLTRDNASQWLGYLEARLSFVCGDQAAIASAHAQLVHLFERASDSDALLRLLLAADAADCLYRLGRLSDAQGWHHEAVGIAEQHGLGAFLTGVAYLNEGSNLRRLNSFASALERFEKSAGLLSSITPRPHYRQGLLMQEKANCHSYLGETRQALDSYQLARDAFEGTSPQRKAETDARIGWVHRLMGDLDRSLDSHRAAVAEFDELIAASGRVPGAPLLALRAKALHSMGNTLRELHRYDDASATYAAAIEEFRKSGPPQHVLMVTIDMTAAQCLSDQSGSALRKLAAAIAKLRSQSGVTPAYGTHIVSGYLALARAHLLRNELAGALGAVDDAVAALGLLDGTALDLAMHVKLEGCLVAASGGQEELGPLLQIEEYANGRGRLDLLACSKLVEAIAQARRGNRDQSEVAHDQARRLAASWNCHLATDIEQIWESQRHPSPGSVVSTV